MADRVRRRHDGGAVDIVGELQQRADEDPVGLRALGEPGIALGGRRQLLRHEAALGAHRHDDGVLHLLRLDEAQHLGAEVLRPVGPAQATAGDLAEAHVHALDARRIDEDLVERPRRRQVVDLLRLELDRDGRAHLPVRAELVEIGAHRRLDQVDEGPEDAVLVERADLGEALLEAAEEVGQLGIALGDAEAKARVEAQVEHQHHALGDGRVLAQRRPEIVLAERRADLPEHAGERADDRHVAPGKARLQRQGVEAVAFGIAPHHRHQCGLELLVERLQVDRLAARPRQRHVVQPDRRRAGATGGDLVGALVHHREAHGLKDRHALR